jgi:hypothetical protein
MSEENTYLRAVVDRLRRMVSLDPVKDQDTGEVAADVALGFIPGANLPLVARDFERARRSDDSVGMGLAAVGALPMGRLASMLRRTPDGVREMVGKRFPEGERVKLSGTEELGGEISDFDTRASDEIFAALPEGDSIPLRELYHHPALYDKYPEVRDTPVFKVKGTGSRILEDRMEIDPEDLVGMDLRRLLTHESQHKVQQYDNRIPTGPRPPHFFRPQEAESRLTEQRMGLNSAGLEANPRADDLALQREHIKNLLKKHDWDMGDAQQYVDENFFKASYPPLKHK